MPPWPPGPGCSEYAGDRSLPEQDRATLLAWVANGAPEGDPAEARIATANPLGLSRVDRTLQIPAAYAPVEAPDEYRCFLLDWPETERRYVTGFAAKPGNASIVHHVLAFLATPDRVSDFQALDDADPAPGYRCFGGPGGVAQALGAWAPGNQGGDFPASSGVQIDPGSRIILQVHYNLTHGLGPSDQTSIELKLGRLGRAPGLPAALGGSAVAERADDADPRRGGRRHPRLHLRSRRVPRADHRQSHPVRPVHGARGGVAPAPARHPLADRDPPRRRSAGVRPRHPTLGLPLAGRLHPGEPETGGDRRQPLHRMPLGQSAGNQPDGLPPRDLNWGERTEDEMCLGFLYITQ